MTANLELKCRGCGAPLTEENRSEAHVIPNALGGNLKSARILCRTCNTALDRLADNALVEAFQSWPTLLDLPRDRGSNPPKIVETRKGRKVRVEADGKLTRTGVRYDVSPYGTGQVVEIEAAEWKTFEQLLARAQKQFPQFDVEAARAHARKVSEDDGDELKCGLDFSPPAVFGGVVSAIWLYLIMTTDHAFADWTRLMAIIENVQRHGGTFRYLVDGVPGLKGPDIPLGHKIVVRGIPATGELVACVEILEVLRIGGVFAQTEKSFAPLQHIYAYDVLGRRVRSQEFIIDAAVFDAQDWKTVGLGTDRADTLRDHFGHALTDVFAARYYARFKQGGGG